MTVAAVILVPDPPVALADVEGSPLIRRVVQAAWSGGALPVVVVSHATEAGAALRPALDGLPATLVLPEDVPPGAGWLGAGLAGAVALVSETEAALLWPCRFGWLDPETVTSLIEAHGADRSSIVRPAFRGEAGFPILVPASHRGRFESERQLHAYQLVERLASEGAAMRMVELGDPGITTDVSTPRSELPLYQGPPEPAAGPAPEWNAELGHQAERSESGSGVG
jgi:CTP:molybdopterin cytidylyltransferase MocA